ncbi:MAG: chemotaxis-specific protein-glutamate methyltransferase CheB [Myxococcales bacterium]|nr:chemotaxis-specific protein-glutamate methyltransferase CheB [Myxococcales bacterium]
MRPVRLAVVDDSTFVRKALQRLFEDGSEVLVVGAADSGEALLRNLDRWRPDVITLDLGMPGIGGLATLDRIMAERPCPVIVLSTHSAEDAPLTMEALHRGAVDFVDKQQYSLVDFESLRQVLLEKILAVGARPSPGQPPSLAAGVRALPRGASAAARAYDIVVVGASTGGPLALEVVLEQLGASLAVPAVIVQHMPRGFTRAFAERLDAHLPIAVQEIRHGTPLRPNCVYIAPGGQHAKLQVELDQHCLVLASEPETPHMPSVDVLFESAAASFGPRVVAVLLTGMGRDGAEGMRALASLGAHTIAQDEASCVVYGMPRAAMLAGAVREQLPLDRIAARIVELVAPR